MADPVAQWQERIRAAAGEGRKLRIVGGGSKDFYGGPLVGEPLETSAHRGIVSYEPTELVVTARGGTPLAEIEMALAERGQCLAFEPPRFGGEGNESQPPPGDGPGPTIGGVVAAGLSGPRRAQVGAVRDFVLGVALIDGRGDLLHFGGEVMKNVAGYDVSRLIAGSLGTLGVIAEVSLKVLPVPLTTQTLAYEMPQAKALEWLNRTAGQPHPVAASCWVDDVLCVRLAGSPAAVAAAAASLGGDPLDDAAGLWASLRDQTHPFFAGSPLWRMSVPTNAPALDVPATQLIEWGGAQRWCISDADPGHLRAIAAAAGGHATLFRGADPECRAAGVFAPLAAPVLAIHRRLKESFDPQAVFNPGRLYPGL